MAHAMSHAVIASHLRGLGLIPGQSIWDLWWTKCDWDRFNTEYFCFIPLAVFCFIYLPPDL